MAVGCYGLNKWSEAPVHRLSQQNSSQKLEILFFQISSIEEMQYNLLILGAFTLMEVGRFYLMKFSNSHTTRDLTEYTVYSVNSSKTKLKSIKNQ